MSYIIGIGGVRATGKSTLARNLGQILRADIISAGREREMIRAQYKHKKLPKLFKSVTNASSLNESVLNLFTQAKIMKPSLAAAIKQCRKKKANLILEGGHIYPGLLKKYLDLEILLVAPKEKLKHRMHKDKKRKISKTTLKRNNELQKYLKNKAKKYKIPIIDTTSLPKALIEIVKLLPSKKLPLTYFA